MWAGALALGLGAIFLSAYAVAHILFTPAMRIGSAMIFSAVLLAAGELLRRNDKRFRLDHGSNAYIPGGLTAAGISGMFAAIYAGHALYGFFGPALTFLLLAAASGAALGLSLLHGPLLAALGILGAYAAPLLTGGSESSYWIVVIYLLAVCFAALALAARRGWTWMEYAAAAATGIWGLLLTGEWNAAMSGPFSLFMMAHAGLFLLLASRDIRPERSDGKAGANDDIMALFRRRVSGALAGLSVLALLAIPMMSAGHYALSVLLTASILFAVMTFAALMWEGMFAALPVAAFVFIASLANWSGARGLAHAAARFSPRLHEFLLQPAPLIETRQALFAILMSLLFAAGGYLRVLRRRGDIPAALVAALTPLCAYALLWMQEGPPSHRLAFFAAAIAGLAAAGAATVAVDRLGRSRTITICGGIFASAGAAFAALALASVLEGGRLTVALSLLAPALAWISLRRDMEPLRWLTAAAVGLVGLRLLADPLYLGYVGATPLFNWLLIGYGVPAAAFALAAWLLRQRKEDIFSDIAEAGAIVMGAALVSVELHHFMTGGRMLDHIDLAESALHTLVWLTMAAAYQYIAGRHPRRVPRYAALAFGVTGLGLALLQNLLVLNPLFTNESIGEGGVFNMLLLLYAMPAIFLYALGRLARAREDEPLATVALTAAPVMLFTWITLEVRALFHTGGHIGAQLGISQGELYAYSLTWLVCAVALLIYASRSGSIAARQTGMALVAMVAGKVFVIDMAGLEGILRALSFIGLGVVLMGIGWVYQRVFATDDTDDKDGGPGSAGGDGDDDGDGAEDQSSGSSSL